MLIYRAEHPRTLTGPFNGYGWEIERVMARSGRRPHNEDMDRFPSPPRDTFGDDLPDRRHGWYCACSSLRQWREWFPKPVAEFLRDHGFELRVYEVHDDYRGLRKARRQVIFRHEGATLVQRLDPVTKLTLT